MSLSPKMLDVDIDRKFSVAVRYFSFNRLPAEAPRWLLLASNSWRQYHQSCCPPGRQYCRRERQQIQIQIPGKLSACHQETCPDGFVLTTSCCPPRCPMMLPTYLPTNCCPDARQIKQLKKSVAWLENGPSPDTSPQHHMQKYNCIKSLPESCASLISFQ